MSETQTNLKYLSMALAIILGMTLLPAFGNAATLCEPTFFLLGKSKAEHSQLSYVLQNTGECEWHVLYKLHFTGSTLDSVQSIRYGGLNEAFDGVDKVSPETAMRLSRDSSGTFHLPYMSYQIRESKPDSAKMAQIDSMHTSLSHGGAPPSSWTRNPGNPADSTWFIQQPEADLYAPIELVYYNPSGLYMDYRIRDVVLFVEAGLLWIETYQPRRMMGGDFAHGVLIYKLVR